jgi:hypothetical protein
MAGMAYQSAKAGKIWRISKSVSGIKNKITCVWHGSESEIISEAKIIGNGESSLMKWLKISIISIINGIRNNVYRKAKISERKASWRSCRRGEAINK